MSEQEIPETQRHYSATDRIIVNAAHFISFIFSPLLIPLYVMCLACYLSYMAVLPFGTLVKVTLTVFALTCLFPLISIGVLYKTGKVSDPGLNNRNERTIPFIISAVSYILCFIYLRMLNAPYWLTNFSAAGLAIAITACLINLKWKISIHLAAMGGLTGFILRLMVSGQTLRPTFYWLLAAIVATGLTGTSRLILERHTPSQVGAGVVAGVLLTYFITGINL